MVQKPPPRPVQAPWVPSWIHGLGAAVWISGPDGRIAFLNQRAEALLGRVASDCIGAPCHEVIAGADAAGRPFCRPLCAVAALARRGREIEPVRLRIADGDSRERWIRVITIATQAPDLTGPWLVHCALSEDRAHRIEASLARIASRSQSGLASREVPRRSSLTLREKEVLRLLAEEQSLKEIAARLEVSYSTVRNHVQHILRKLEVHSLVEAVACHLLAGD